MALYHKWDVKNDLAYVLQFFSLISDGLSGVQSVGLAKWHSLMHLGIAAGNFQSPTRKFEVY